MNYFAEIEPYFETLKRTVDQVDRKEIQKAMEILVKARDEKKYIFIMGNGGSAATASHYAGDFNKGLSLNRNKRFRFVALNDNAPTVLSLANDVSYDAIFVEQLKNFLDGGDVVIAISGSGNSKNIINAVEYAKAHGNKVIGITGFSGGQLKTLCDISLHAPINSMQITEDIHMIFDHLMMSVILSMTKY
jgi:D-sedoheptulose 7-phosphate isomerase